MRITIAEVDHAPWVSNTRTKLQVSCIRGPNELWEVRFWLGNVVYVSKFCQSL